MCVLSVFSICVLRSKVPPLCPCAAPRHQARQPPGQLELLPQDLRLRPGAYHGAGRVRGHDARGGHSVLPRAGDLDGRGPLHVSSRHLVSRVHLCRAAQSENLVPGISSSTAGKYK